MKNLFLKLLGPLLAGVGVLGLTGSSILWNFQGRGLGLPATIASLLTLAVGVILLRPLPAGTTPASANTVILETTDQEPSTESADAVNPGDNTTADSTLAEAKTQVSVTTDTSTNQKPLLTTAEVIAAQLAAEEASQKKIVLVNFAPDALSPGNDIRTNKRSPGSNLSGFREMASELFKTN